MTWVALIFVNMLVFLLTEKKLSGNLFQNWEPGQNAVRKYEQCMRYDKKTGAIHSFLFSLFPFALAAASAISSLPVVSAGCLLTGVFLLFQHKLGYALAVRTVRREITRAFCDDDFKGFEREKKLDLTYVCFTDYDETIQNKLVAFHKQEIKNTFGEYLAAHNMTQARIAETEKYAHVTFFFNGGVEEPNEGEERILVKSPKVATYDLKPEMSAYEVCDKLVEAIKSDKYDVIIINFANPDMVGHTGVEAAAIKAVEAVDECVGKAVEALKEVDGQMFICADHGNAEQLIDYETGEPFTAHTTNPVPFILVNADPSYTLREGGCLADIIPTLIELMGMEQPAEMTGKSLLIKK